MPTHHGPRRVRLAPFQCALFALVDAPPGAPLETGRVSPGSSRVLQSSAVTFRVRHVAPYHTAGVQSKTIELEAVGTGRQRRWLVGSERARPRAHPSRDWLGRLRHALILTRALPNAGTLVEFVRKRCPDRLAMKSRNMRDALVGQHAEITRRIHEAGFFHNDLYWRNILVEWSPGREPTAWWVDCPRGNFAAARCRLSAAA